MSPPSSGSSLFPQLHDTLFILLPLVPLMKLPLSFSLALVVAVASAHKVSFKKIKQPTYLQKRAYDSPSNFQTNVVEDSTNSTFDLRWVCYVKGPVHCSSCVLALYMT